MEDRKQKEVKSGYSLARQWFDWAFSNPDKVSPVHTALYLWLCELNNRMGWAEKFGAASSMSMSAVGIKHHTTYKKAFDDLVLWGFVKLIEKSKNQYSANVISLSAMSKNSEAHSEALDKALSGAYSEAHAVYINNKPMNLKPEIDGQPVNISEIIDYLNEKADKKFKHNSDQTKVRIIARQKEGYEMADFLKVIDNKVAGWKDDPEMNKYLRPSTLFGTKFEAYLNEKIIPQKKKGNSPASIDIEGLDHSQSF
jgi:uncharacterized phage protein (TIGR02220 family)